MAIGHVSPDGEQGVDHRDVALYGHGDGQVHGHHQAGLQRRDVKDHCQNTCAESHAHTCDIIRSL